jgi:hypothetical protein
MSTVPTDLLGSDAVIGQPVLLSAATITGDEVRTLKGEKLGAIQDLMLDPQSGAVRYVVLSVGGFLSMGDRSFAIPWSALKFDGPNRGFTLDVDVERLNAAPGFDKGEWPVWSDAAWSALGNTYYRTAQFGSTPLPIAERSATENLA